MRLRASPTERSEGGYTGLEIQEEAPKSPPVGNQKPKLSAFLTTQVSLVSYLSSTWKTGPKALSPASDPEIRPRALSPLRTPE